MVAAPSAGAVVWVDLGETVGNEQRGRRPAVVIGSDDLREAVRTLTIVVPCSSRDRGWPNHVELTGSVGLDRPTFAITEQPRALSMERIHGLAGVVDSACLTTITRWVHTWLEP